MGKELPNNWVETKLGEVTTSYKGKKPKVLVDEEKEGFVPYLDIKAFEHNEIRQWAEIESSKIIDEKSLAIVWDGARSGWTAKGKLGALGSTMAFINPIEVNINYLYYFLQLKFDFINTNTRGIGIPHVDPTILWDINFPLPPLPEQNRIIKKLDALFGHLEQIKSRLEKVPVLLLNFRQAVLNQAVTGKLTEEWRVGRELEEWKENVLKEIADVIDPNPKHRNPPYFDKGFLFLSTAQFGANDDWDYSTAKYVSEETILEQEARCNFTIGSIAFSRKGTIGKTRILPFDKRFALLDSVCVINAKFGINYKFLNYSLRSRYVVKQVENLTRGVALKQVSLGAVRSLIIPIPDILEQNEIANRVESLFAKADKIEQQYQALKEKIDALPQAILAKAFKGELVEQLPTDGDARELLAEIERLKEEGKDQGRGKGRSRKIRSGGRMVAEAKSKYGK